MDVAHYKTPLSLFRQGMDTVEIGKHLGCSEATAANLIHRAKEAERYPEWTKSANYWEAAVRDNQKPKSSGIAYAGKE